MFYIAGSFRTILRGKITSCNFFYGFKYLVQGSSFTESNIINLVDCCRILREQCTIICMHSITNISKIPAMFTISIDQWWFVIQNCLNEQWYYSCIRSLWILFGTKYIKVPQPYQFQFIKIGKDPGV